MKISPQSQEFEISPEDVKAVQGLVDFLMPESVKQLAGVLTDTIKGWRAVRMVKVMVKTKKMITESGLSRQELSGKFFIATIEKSGLEDDDSLQNKWATLLTNASLGKIDQDIKYVSILSELNSGEVKLLDILYSELLKNQNQDDYTFLTQKVSDTFKINITKAKIMVDNFYRLNICQPPAMDGFVVGRSRALLRTNDSFTFTDLGKDFVRSCTKNF